MSVKILVGDVRARLRKLPSESIHCVVTSPPYWNLRTYGIDGQIGLERTPEEHVATMVEVFREVRRVLRKDGTLWMNYGDVYAQAGGSMRDEEERASDVVRAQKYGYTVGGWSGSDHINRAANTAVSGLKPKDLVGMPWRVALALQADGWWLRQDIIFHKLNPMPESVTDRCTKSHEYIFLLTKSANYYFDADAIREKSGNESTHEEYAKAKEQTWPSGGKALHAGAYKSEHAPVLTHPLGRNRRSVWSIATEPFHEAHFAVFPTKLVEPCILAGTSMKGCCSKCGAPWKRQTEKAGYSPSTTIGWSPSCGHGAKLMPCIVLDPFGGAGTTGVVAQRFGRHAILIELNSEYAEMARNRIIDDAPLFSKVVMA